MNSPAKDITSYLGTSASGTGLTEATNLFYNKMPDTPDAVVSVHDTGGGAPSSSAEKLEYPTVQVLIRGAKMGYDTGYATAEDVKNALHKLVKQTINSTTYISIWATTDIFFLENDSDDRPIFSINFRIYRTS